MKKRLIKISLWFLGIILGLVLIISSGLLYFKDDICGYVISQVNQYLKVKVTVAKVDLTFWNSFPNLSVDFDQVFVQDSFEKSTATDTLLYTDRIRLKFNPIDIWNENYHVEKIAISPGTLKLKVNKKGEVNYDILKPTSDSTKTKFKLSLEKVEFTEIEFTYKNDLTNQFYAASIDESELSGNFTENQFTLASSASMLIRSVRSGRVPLISKKRAHFDIVLNVNQALGTIDVPPCTIFIANLPFDLHGGITPEHLNLNLKAKQLQLTDVIANFKHASIDDIEKFGGSGIVQFDLTIDGALKKEVLPTITCDFGIEHGTLIDPLKGLHLSAIELEGKFSNEKGADKEFLKLSHISFNSPGGPFQGNVLLTNFSAPKIVGNAKGNINLNVANQIFPVKNVRSIEGDIHVNSDFEFDSYLDSNSVVKTDLTKCEGEVEMNNVQLQLIDDKREFKDVFGNLYFRNNEAGIDSVRLRVGRSDLLVSGVFQEIMGYLKGTNKLKANAEVTSSFLNVQDLSTETKQEQIRDGRNWILPNDLEGNVAVNVGELKYEKHVFKDLIGQLKMTNRRIYFPDLTLKNAGAFIRGNVTIEERNPEIFTISTHALSENVEIKPLFQEWENFHQDVITADNVYGKLRVLLEFEAPFDLRSGILSNEIKSKIQLKMIDGRLKDVLAFKSLTASLKTSSAKFVLNKKDIASFESKLLDLKFKNFENTFVIRDGHLEIPSMVIESNALDMKLEGTHDFSNKIDYRFVFRFRELKEQKTQDEFGEIIDDGLGIKLFVRMFGEMSKPTIIWDETAKKQQAKENRDAAKKDAKAILKSEFGLFKKDSTVQNFKPIEKPKEELKLEFESNESLETKPKEVKKNTKINSTLNKWKKQTEKQKEEEFDL